MQRESEVKSQTAQRPPLAQGYTKQFAKILTFAQGLAILVSNP